jgi:hypothetical protein
LNGSNAGLPVKDQENPAMKNGSKKNPSAEQLKSLSSEKWWRGKPKSAHPPNPNPGRGRKNKNRSLKGNSWIGW